MSDNEPRIVPPGEARDLVGHYERYNVENWTGVSNGVFDQERDLAHTAAVRGEQREAALALHDGNHICMSVGGEVLPFGPRSIRGSCPTARALGASDA